MSTSVYDILHAKYNKPQNVAGNIKWNPIWSFCFVLLFFLINEETPIFLNKWGKVEIQKYWVTCPPLYI